MAGINLLHYVQNDFKITLIEKREYFEWIWMLPKSILDSGSFFEDEATADLRECIEDKKVFGDNVNYIQAIMTQVVDQSTLKIKRTGGLQNKDTLEKNALDLSNIEEEEIKFDYLVLWTGSNYIANEQNVTDVAHIFTREQRKAYLNKYKKDMEEANSILVVGGGPTGCETVAELLIQHGNKKKIGLLHGTDKLLPGFPDAARDHAKTSFERSGVEVILNTRYNPEMKKTMGYDFTLICIGTKFYTPYFDNDKFSDWKDARGRIFVNDHLQVTNLNPLVKPDPQINKKVYKNIFCHGDACVTKMNEAKNVPALMYTAEILAYNLKQTYKAMPRFKSVDVMCDNASSVYLSGNDGVLVLNGFTKIDQNILNMKKQVQEAFVKYIKDERNGRKGFIDYIKQKNCMFCCFNNCCCCCPCSSKKAKSKRRAELRAILNGETA